MKRICLVLAAFATLTATAQNKVVIKGTLPDLPNDTMMRLWSPFQEGYDSTVIKNHSFTFTKTLTTGNGNVFIISVGNVSDEKKGTILFLEPGEVNITGKGPYFSNATYTGSSFIKEWVEVCNTILDTAATFSGKRKLVAKQDAAGAVGDMLAMDELEPQVKVYNNQQAEMAKAWIKKNPNSGVGAYLVAHVLSRTMSKDEQLEYLSKMPAKVQQTSVGFILKRQMGIGLEINEMAPAFSVPDVNGKMVSLSDYKGKYVLVDFWASWCAPCRAQNGALKAAYEKYKDKNFTIVSISTDEQKDKWLKAVAEDKQPWAQLADMRGTLSPVMQDYQVVMIPVNFLIGPDGKIIGMGYQNERLEKKLAEILK
jgi:peroxiredoxin